MIITILNMPENNSFEYLKSLVYGFNKHKRFKDATINLISEKIHENKEFCYFRQFPINFINELPSTNSVLKEYATNADIVFVMCNTTDNDIDGYTFDLVNRLTCLEKRPKYIVAEVDNDSDRKRILSEGADAVIRPTRTYPSVFIRTIASIGSEEILEKLISIDTKYKKIDVNKHNLKWSDVFFQYYSEFGAAVGFYDFNNNIHLNPKFDNIYSIKSVLFFKIC
jgi:hypothetical protein